jgi:hypothetical protein
MLAAALVFWLSPAAVHAQRPTSSSIQLPLAGTVSAPLTDGTVEDVPLSGFVHVFAQVRTPSPLAPIDPYRIQINLDQVSGVGVVSGFRYQGTGSFRINLPTAPVDPISASFDLRVPGLPPSPILPPNPILPPSPILPLDISFLFDFIGGTLNNVVIDSISVPD